MLGLILSGSMVVLPSLLQRAPAQAWSVWQTLKAPEGNFSILMPGQSDRTRKTIRILGKSAVQTTWSATQWQHDAHYSIHWTELPSAWVNPNHQQKTFIFEEMLTELSLGLGAQLLQETNLTLAGYPGKQYQLRSWIDGEPYQIHSRAFLVGSRFFQISVTLPERSVAGLAGSTRGFLQSFRLR